MNAIKDNLNRLIELGIEKISYNNRSSCRFDLTFVNEDRFTIDSTTTNYDTNKDCLAVDSVMTDYDASLLLRWLREQSLSRNWDIMSTESKNFCSVTLLVKGTNQTSQSVTGSLHEAFLSAFVQLLNAQTDRQLQKAAVPTKTKFR